MEAPGEGNDRVCRAKRRDLGATRPAGQSGFTLLEALIALVVTSVAVMAIAGGLLLSTRVDNQTNAQQRANLALTTFMENIEFVQAPSASADCGTGSGGPAVSSPGVSNPPSHAAQLMGTAVADPEVQTWINRGMMFRITSVTYGTDDSGPGAETFGSDCSAPTAEPKYPVIKITAEACRASAAAVSCGESVAVDAEVVKRGGRTG